mmetsp:Transcript_42657/g.114211  ORF Transcript_42657/g.114211 Transcript_42657/m.114211 type:complete len:238 (-) Transcript_42657:5-718(-)
MSAMASTPNGRADETVLSHIDQMMSSIEEMDPSLADDFRVIYDRECPFELRVQDAASDGPQQVGTLEAIKVKMLIQGEDAGPTGIRIELSSESDLFFHYHHTLDEVGFQAVQEQQKLMVEFPEYPNVLIRMLNSCIKEPHSHLAVFVMQHNAEERAARLDFIQNMEYKFVELMSCQYEHTADEAVQQHISYRYNAMKSRLSLVQTRLQEVNNLVRLKNPSLLLQLQKAPAGTGMGRR